MLAFIEEGYHSTNPYHNSTHATDVTQAMHCFLQEKKIRMHLTNLEIMASLIAAVTHDLDHPGVNQPFLVATSNHLAALYQNTSVLENHHWRSAIGCLLESGVSDQLPANVRPELQRHISSLILATDITRQQEFLVRFKHYLDENRLEMKRAEDRHFILQIALKCADISNPCRPWDISRKWSYKVCEEFFRQGDYERRLNLPVTPLCDRHTTSIPKIQIGFIKFVVTPLYEEWHRFLGDGLSVSLMEHLRGNQKKWETLVLQETTEETETEISELDEAEDAVSSTEDPAADEDTGSIDLLIPAAYVQSSRMQSLPARVGLERVGRRHSVPLSISKTLTLLPRSTVRRESLPSEHSKGKSLSPRFDDHSFLEPSSFSLLSSKSSIHELSPNTNATERPVSAESLLPETSIASITNSTEASRLSSVLQPDNQNPGTQSKQLTRQQTFPPLQPYVRMRYLSTTAEMSQCYSQILMEADSSSSSSCSTKEKPCLGGHCGTPPISEVDTLQVKRNIEKVSRESVSADIVGKRRSSAIADTIRPKTDVTSTADHPRRHSVQAIRIDDTNLKKNRHKRPASAQGTDSTQVFYTSLTGCGCGDKDTRDIETECKSECVSTSKVKHDSEKVTCEDQRTTTPSSKSDQCSSMHVTKAKCVESELRRYSTPVPEIKTIMTDASGRRFTAIPVSSELSTHKVFFIGSPPDSPPLIQSISSSSDSGSEPRKSIGDNEIVSTGSKRDSDSVKEKSSKVAKLNLDVQMKENVDPRAVEDPKGITPSRKGSQSWARRRGSAPVGLLSRLDDITVPPITSTRVDHTSRRGSVPTDITRHQGGGFNRLALGVREGNVATPRRASLPQETALGNLIGNILSLTNERENLPINNNNNNNNTGTSNNNGLTRIIDSTGPGMPSPRRGSVPADISELRRDMFNRSSINGKPRNRKKVLKRRSSGGPEMFSVRGSLPIEMVAISHAGRIGIGNQKIQFVETLAWNRSKWTARATNG
ncbi:High affinity cAMP-specific 3',5'-cyclic phosphodiesterase 7A [Dufourea novaeangliae]|uniref:Phosphodiesterase n=1 Tax=Dufourea novaeangliae TaxID=178035 RepID=A0A154P9S0_DUFNO|nr:High affinity cAMP-specific 3',5'-cyclic phosphodiesterase 7A [Dufourea novaeangliae]